MISGHALIHVTDCGQTVIFISVAKDPARFIPDLCDPVSFILKIKHITGRGLDLADLRLLIPDGQFRQTLSPDGEQAPHTVIIIPLMLRNVKQNKTLSHICFLQLIPGIALPAADPLSLFQTEAFCVAVHTDHINQPFFLPDKEPALQPQHPVLSKSACAGDNRIIDPLQLKMLIHQVGKKKVRSRQAESARRHIDRVDGEGDVGGQGSQKRHLQVELPVKHDAASFVHRNVDERFSSNDQRRCKFPGFLQKSCHQFRFASDRSNSSPEGKPDPCDSAGYAKGGAVFLPAGIHITV